MRSCARAAIDDGSSSLAHSASGQGTWPPPGSSVGRVRAEPSSAERAELVGPWSSGCSRLSTGAPLALVCRSRHRTRDSSPPASRCDSPPGRLRRGHRSRAARSERSVAIGTADSTVHHLPGPPRPCPSLPVPLTRPSKRSTWNARGIRSSTARDQYQGRRDGTPTRRGARSGQGPITSSCWIVLPGRRQSGPGRSPSSESGAAGHRSGPSIVGSEPLCGGSLTRILAPAPLRKPTAHSAVTGGGAKDLAVTTSKTPRNSESRATTSALPRTTRTRGPSRSSSVASTRNDVRRSAASSRTTLASVITQAMISPGTPPPEPRSRILNVRDGRGDDDLDPRRGDDESSRTETSLL